MLYAHINRGKEMQLLQEHCENTYKQIENDAKKRELNNCMKLISLLHDSGKASDAFQEYLKKAALENITLPKVNHSSAGAQILLENLESYNGSETILAKLMLVQSIVSHHGLNDFIDICGNNKLYTRCYPNNEINLDYSRDFIDKFIGLSNLANIFDEANKEIQVYLREFKKQNKHDQCEDFIFNLSALQRLMTSMLIYGDHEDTRNFMIGTKTPVYNENEIWHKATSQLEEHLKNMNESNQSSIINSLRMDISNQCKRFGEQPVGIYRLSCPTGSGKTLASLRYALKHATKYHKKRIIYVAPYKTILEQNATIFKTFFEEENVLEHHSNIIPSEYEDYDYYSSSWNKPVILTTAVRFFDTLFKDRICDVRRFHQLSDSILILDEAQNIPVKTVYMFNSMMNFLAFNCNTTIVLCTATQPLLEKVSYPIALSSDSEIVHLTNEQQDIFKRVHIYNACKQDGYTIQELTSYIFEKLMKDDSMLVIVNTKAEALNLYHSCKLQNNNTDLYIYHLSSSMCPQHRNDKLKMIKQLMEDKKPILCISTNLIEAGIDLDFTTVIRSLAGLDSIIQVAGRCNRNGKNTQLGSLYLINSREESIDKLRDIKKGQEETIQLLSSLHVDVENENIDKLLTNAYIEKYYQSYFFERRKEMVYLDAIGEKKVSLFNLLSKPITEKPYPNKLYHPFLGVALKSVGQRFQIIDSNTTGILVPYGYGADLIIKLQSNISNTEKYKILDQIQRYTINVYSSKLEELKRRDMLIQLDFIGLLVLKNGYYKEYTGLEVNKELDDLFV